MSHELRTPLNAILGFAQWAQLDARGEEERENVEQILKGGQHLLQLINEVLDISRIEAGQMPLFIEPVPLGTSLKVALSLMRPMASDRQIALGDLDCDYHVLADEQRLQQVLLNLLSNAIKYNRKGGRVTLTCYEHLAGPCG